MDVDETEGRAEEKGALGRVSGGEGLEGWGSYVFVGGLDEVLDARVQTLV